MDIRKLELADQEVYRAFEADMLADKEHNPFVELTYIDDLPKAIREGQHSEEKQEGQTWSTYSTYYAFVNGEIAGLLRCFWEAENEAVVKLGQIGYMVRPKFRRQGFAMEMLAFAKDLYAQKGYEKVSIATSQDNFPSRCLIEKAGGQLESLSQFEYFGKKLQVAKYWLTLQSKPTFI
ncbi:GNAT family N-acetyltransferase [Streptococcus gallolyticus]|nr:GNAT family N-acetyltransferase [Streptococcus gallolyticus]MBY5040575.1 GNAT family N-acetyltransferase [Streptococcus gallolyticus]